MTSSRWVPAAACAALLLLSLPAARCAPSAIKPAAPAPRLVLERAEYDAGKVVSGEIVRAEFPIRNAGNAPLSILDIKTDCGCTVPSCDESIGPGQTGHARVALKTNGFQGPIEKHVYLETDDPKMASVMLTIKAVLPRAVEVTPGNEVVIPVTRGKASTLAVTLRATDETPLDVGTIESAAPYVTAEIAPGTPAGGPQVSLRLTVAADAPSETFETLVTVSTGHPRLPRLGIRVFGQPAAAVTVRPPRLAFGRVRPDARGPLERLLALTRATGGFHVLKAEDTLGCLRLQVVPGPDSSYCEIQVVYVGGWKDEQTQGVIRITTDDPARPVVEVPYTAQVW